MTTSSATLLCLAAVLCCCCAPLQLLLAGRIRQQHHQQHHRYHNQNADAADLLTAPEPSNDGDSFYVDPYAHYSTPASQAAEAPQLNSHGGGGGIPSHLLNLQIYGDASNHRWRNESVYTTMIALSVFDAMGQTIYRRAVADVLAVTAVNEWDWWQCDPRGQFAIVVHGWRESCETKWVRMLVEQLHQHRGGCIMCFDYSHFANDVSYFRLMRHFDPIAASLTLLLQQLEQIGFALERGYVFGFSFGGQLAVEAGRRVGTQRLGAVDTCDMAGPGFDHRAQQPDHRLAARNVQCVHTASGEKGTRHFRCHQNWRLGNCGYWQVASGDPPCGSHGLCPYMYVAAFEREFRAVRRPRECAVGRTEALDWPPDFRMGYMEERKSLVNGELFAHTAKLWPYAVAEEQAANVTIIKWTPPEDGADATANYAEDADDSRENENDEDYGWKASDDTNPRCSKG